MFSDSVFSSRKVIHSGLEEGLVEVAGDVLGDIGAAAFGVTHFS